MSYRTLTWAEDGRSVFFGVKTWEPAEDEDESEEGEGPEGADGSEADEDDAGDEASGVTELDPAEMEIWRSIDERTLVTQKRQEQRDEERNDLFVRHLDSSRALRLTDESLDGPRVVADGRLVLATDDEPYTFDGMFGRGRSDLYAIDPITGEHQIAAEGITFPYGADDSGRYVHFYRDGHFYAFDRDAGTTVSLSEDAGQSFANLADDHPTPSPPSYGVVGWSEPTGAGSSLFVYDEFDVWELPIDGAPRRITAGRDDEITHRIVRLDPDAGSIDLDEDIYVSLRGKWTLHHGIARIRGSRVERLLYVDDNVGRFAKASDADVYAYVAQDFDDSPDYFVGDFDDAHQVTHTNPFQDEYAWGHTELVP